MSDLEYVDAATAPEDDVGGMPIEKVVRVHKTNATISTPTLKVLLELMEDNVLRPTKFLSVGLRGEAADAPGRAMLFHVQILDIDRAKERMADLCDILEVMASLALLRGLARVWPLLAVPPSDLTHSYLRPAAAASSHRAALSSL